MADFAISTIDRQSKRTTMKLPVADAATPANLQAIVDAIDAIILGSDASGTLTTSTTIDSGLSTIPTNKSANRGNKWLLRIQDPTPAVNRIFTYEIGTADDDQLPAADSDFLDLTAGPGLALKTAIEAEYVSPYGNAGILLSVQQVNRADN